MSEEDLVHLCDAVLVVGKFILADVDGFGLFGKGSHAFHVLSIGAESLSTEDVFGLVDQLALF